MIENTAYDALMEDICVGLGFCGCIKDERPLHVSHFIPSRGSVTADQFAEWVFLADDMNPNSGRKSWEHLKDRIRQAFIRHMGSEVVDAKLLKWGDGEPYVLPTVDEPLFTRVDIWRPLSPHRALRYNCMQHVQSGNFRVGTVDVFEIDGEFGSKEDRAFAEAVMMCEQLAPEQDWFGSPISAIAAHLTESKT